MGLVVAEAICISAFILEIHRALSGNSLSWAYVFEWPVFAAYAIYVWRKLLKDVRSPEPLDPVPPEEPDDPALVAFNEYLRQVHKHS